MLRSLYSGVSGMRNHQTKMDVVGNNIANVNTTAFKGGRVRFQDVLSQTLRGGSGPMDARGGINPMQVGLGMSIAAIDNNHTQGGLQFTGIKTDLAIEGKGFFVVSSGERNYYTRDGAFSLDPDGFLVNSANGMRLQGWGLRDVPLLDADGNPVGDVMIQEVDTNQPLGNLNIPLGGDRIVRATENIFVDGNMNARSDMEAPDLALDDPDNVHHLINTIVYDSLGFEHDIQLRFIKTDAIVNGPSTWEWAAYIYNQEDQAYSDELFINDDQLNFDLNGKFVATDNGVPLEYIITLDNIDPETGALEPQDITIDFRDLTQLVGPSDAMTRYQDGYPSGVLDSFNIQVDGTISGIYSNGLVRSLGVVALAGFANPEGLTKAAGNLFQVSPNSGPVIIGQPGIRDLGVVQESSLEMSNVDLVAEFTEMITTSRAFQANSRIITTSDEMLMETLNLKR